MFRWLQTHHQSVTALAAIIVSVVALFVAWDQANVMRSQQLADVWPALQADNQTIRTAEGLSAGFRVQNAGVGPAMVRQVSLVRRDGTVADGYADFASHFPETSGFANESLSGRILAAGASTVVLRLLWDTELLTPELLDAVNGEIGEWALTACYCSVLDDCWVAESHGYAEPQPVERCEMPEARRF